MLITNHRACRDCLEALGVEITREQADILEKAGRATHVKSDRGTDRIIDGHPSRFEDNQVQLAARTANTICKEDQEYVCDGARVNARYVFGKAIIKWGSLVITRDVSAGSELYVKYGDKAVTRVVFEGTNGEAPEELTVLLAKSASAMQYEALTLRGREPAERIAEIHQAAERYQKVPCECSGACSLHFMLQTCWDYVYITCAFKRWRRSNLSDAPRSSSTLHDRIVPHGRRGRVDFSDAVHPEPAGAAAHRAVRLAAGLPCSKPIQCNHHRLMF